MSATRTVLGLAALLGAALMAGTFYAFSTFVMAALGRIPAAQGMAAMQSINVAVINRWFLSVFVGTAVLSVALVALALFDGQPGSLWMLSGGLAYALGTFLVTVVGNVPLNNELARAPATEPEGHAVWGRYLYRWTKWNHVRTAFAGLATVLFALGLMATAGRSA